MNQIIVRVIDEFFKREIQRPWEIPYRNKPVFTFAVSAPSAPSVSNILLLDLCLPKFYPFFKVSTLEVLVYLFLLKYI